MRVLISGAGIAGPSLAWFLARAGIQVTVVEKSKALLAQGQNIDIKGSAITVAKKMGILEEIRRFNTTEVGTRMIDPQGRPFAPFPVQKGNAQRSGTAEYEILRGDLASILYEASKDHPNIKYLFNTTVAKVVSNDDASVKVELSDGSVQDYDLLVAADGQWSKLRRDNFPPEKVNVVDKDMYVVYFTIPRLPTDDDWWNVYLASHARIITTRPDPHGTIRAMFTSMPCNDEERKAWAAASRSDRGTQEKYVREVFANAGWQARRLLDSMHAASDFYFQPLQQIKMSKWSHSRIICLGDAAFAPTPLTGQGTSLAMVGAYILAGEINKLQPGEHLSKALDNYEAIYRPFVEQQQVITPIFPGVMHPNSAWHRWLLQCTFSLLSKVVAMPWLANRLFKNLDSEEDNDGFKLPVFPELDNAISR